MRPQTLWERVSGWLQYLPLRFAYRIVWLMAKAGSPLAREHYKTLWKAGINLPRLTKDQPDV